MVSFPVCLGAATRIPGSRLTPQELEKKAQRDRERYAEEMKSYDPPPDLDEDGKVRHVHVARVCPARPKLTVRVRSPPTSTPTSAAAAAARRRRAPSATCRPSCGSGELLALLLRPQRPASQAHAPAPCLTPASKQNRAIAKTENPDASMTGISSILGHKWNAMDQTAREVRFPHGRHYRSGARA